MGRYLKQTKIYAGTTLLADLIPAVDGNNVACFYDAVRDTTYYSAGTAFAAGTAYSDGEIIAAYAKVSGIWQPLIGTNINDINLGN